MRSLRQFMARLVGAAGALGAGALPWACAEHAPPPAPTPFDGITLAQACTIPETMSFGSIPAFVASLKHGYSFSTLSLGQMNAVIASTRALDTGDLRSAWESAQEANYRLVPLQVATDCFLLLQPTETAPPGHALLLYAAQWGRNLVIEAPHVPEDHRTDEEGAVLFGKLRAKALVIAGAHRCAVPTPSGCKSSTECGPSGVAFESDASHSINNAVNAIHLAFRTTDAVTVQLHTNFKPALNGDILISNGTHYPIAGTAADAFYLALKAPDVDVRSCNDPSIPSLKGAFCGETNTQSLASNGAADQCLGAPSSRGGPAVHRFIHVEQNNQRMDALDAWAARVGAALGAAVPLSQ